MGKMIFDRQHQKWLEIEELAPASGGASIAILKRKAKRNRKFAMVPLAWVDKLAARPPARGATWHLAIHILYLDWKENVKPFSGQWFKLTNKSLPVTRWIKGRALRNLERRGLIEVNYRPRKSPLIRILPLN